MGAWGSGPLDDDAATDFPWLLEGADDRIGVVREAFEKVIAAEKVEVMDGYLAAAAAYTLAEMRKGVLDTWGDPGDDHYEVCLSLMPIVDDPVYRRKAADALDRMMGEQSHLREYLADLDDDGEAWDEEWRGRRAAFSDQPARRSF